MRRVLAQHRCPGCEIRKALCFCAAIPRIELKIRVFVLMHTAEEVLTTNTARLTAKALVNSEIRIRGRKNERMSTVGLVEPKRTSLLLYPSPYAEELSAEFVARLAEPVNLIVPDGSWRQTQKMVRREEVFHDLRHVKLPPGPPTEYKLRIQPEEHGLCTLEAIARSLGILESPAAQSQLEALLRVMVDRTLWSRGSMAPELHASANIPRGAFSNEPSAAGRDAESD
ncbi:MAG: DTW domain-containing protein [Planctomycetia bacterium]|nr:DTW domain-containing protein [Planctomycetia bacterium]